MENKDQIIQELKEMINQLKSEIKAAYICYDGRANADAEQFAKSQDIVKAVFDELYKEQTKQETHDELEKRFK